MEQWVSIAERFGLPMVMLLGMSYGMVQLFKWLANDLMKQIADNHSRIENIIVKLIDNSKEERQQNRQNMNEILSRMDQTISIMSKLSGNGLKKK
ncbi:MAG: hypothetical protein Unbinned4234contig1003_12 [Prokaryotic dsDNA virus sp.]|nr:MAG: hypothetical protein Unbinned4234contig1003_12 [Prokaryotic dsDNA virus sp.]